MANILLAEAVILSVDSAACSGVAISIPELYRGRVRDYEVLQLGLAKSPEDRFAWVRDAVQAAKDEGLPLVVAAEHWSRHGLSNRALESLQQTWGRWLEWIDLERLRGAKGVHVVQALPDVWRSAVFGKHRGKIREDLKKQAVLYADRVLGFPMLANDVAEALCVRVWASRADEVHALLDPRPKPPKRRLLRSGKVPS